MVVPMTMSASPSSSNDRISEGCAWMICRVQPGAASRTAPTSVGSSASSPMSVMQMVKVRLAAWGWNPASLSRPLRTSEAIASTVVDSSSPRAVGVTPVALLVNRGSSKKLRSRLSEWLTALCVTCSEAAARVTLRYFSRASNTRTRLRSSWPICLSAMLPHPLHRRAKSGAPPG